MAERSTALIAKFKQLELQVQDMAHFDRPEAAATLSGVFDDTSLPGAEIDRLLSCLQMLQADACACACENTAQEEC